MRTNLGFPVVAIVLLLSALVRPGAAEVVTTLTDVIDGGSGGLAVDAAGNVYIGDFGPDLGGHGTRVFRSTPAGEVSVFASGFDGASGNDFDSAGNLYQSNINAWRIDRIAPDGTVTPFTSAGIYGPVGIAIDEGDTLYVCNCGTNNIRKVTPTGVSTNFASSALLQCPNGITFADDGNLYVANFQNGDVLRITPDGTVHPFVTIPGDNNGHLTFHDGLLYVAARDANQIYSVTLAGEVTLFAGSGERGLVDGSLLEAQFSLPNDLIVDPTGSYMYVNDVVDAQAFNSTAPMILRRIDLGAVAGVGAPRGEVTTVPARVRSVGPNPFGASTTIAFQLDRPLATEITIYDVHGRAVRRLLERRLEAGTHEVFWAGNDAAGHTVAPGVYFYRLSTPAGAAAGQVLRIR